MSSFTEQRASKCTTHHYACDCREYRFQEMERALRDIRTFIANTPKDKGVEPHEMGFLNFICEQGLGMERAKR